MSEARNSIQGGGKSSKEKEQMSTNVQVAVRCRPTNEEERKVGQPTVVACDTANKQVNVSYGPSGKKITKTFNFDKVFGMYSSQQEVFDGVVKPIVEEVLAGFNCTIFAYGQTGTGKTHTMEGDINNEENAGIVPRSVRSIFEQLESSGLEFTVRVSFLELYNEELQDLLATDKSKQLKLCEDVKKGVVCQNLEEITVLNVDAILEILQRGIKERQTAATLMNKNSSRSHSIFTMKIMIKECNVEGEEVVRHGQMNLVDLAGSECVGRSGAKNERAREAGSINQSLLTLGRVITALVDHHGHIPYRDSKLTRILQESLGGKAKTCIIATLSPSQLNMEESMSTLDYAHRAKSIKNIPQVNQKMTKKVALGGLCAEIEQLRAQLQITRDKNGVYVDPVQFANMESRIESQESMLLECEAALKSRNEELKLIKSEINVVEEKLDQATKQLHVKEEELKIKENQLQEVEKKLESTELELMATEAVVNEQSITEIELSNEAKKITKEVLARRSEVDSLFSKLDRIFDTDYKRNELFKAFTSKINMSKEELQKIVADLAASNSKEASVLTEGVKEMIDTCRNTCVSLKESIQGSLKILLDGATSAKESMSTSCDQLTSHLNTTNKHIEATLLNLEKSLSDWLSQVDDSMKLVQEKLEEQDGYISSATDKINEKVATVSGICSDFYSLQQKYCASQKVSASELKRGIFDLAESYQQEEEMKFTAASELLHKKADDIQNTFTKMMQEMIQSSLSTYSDSKNSIASFTSKLVDMSSASISDIESINKESVDSIDSFRANYTESIQNLSNLQKDEFSGLNSIRNEAVKGMGNICETVSIRKSELNSTVSSLVGHVDSATAEGCQVVKQTQDTSNNILNEIRNATQDMKGSAYSAIDNFTNLLDNRADELSGKLESHFVALQSTIESEKKSIASIDENIVSFNQENHECVNVPTGQTPKKTKYDNLASLPFTRNHNDIKAEAKECKTLKQRTNSAEAEAFVRSESPKQTSSSCEEFLCDDSPSSMKKRKAVDASVISSENANPQLQEILISNTAGVSKASTKETNQVITNSRTSKIARGSQRTA